MNEVQYYEAQEMAEMGRAIAANAKAIFDAYDCKTMADLQRAMYKYTKAGVYVSFQLHPEAEQPDVHCGDQRASEMAEPWTAIRSIGVGSIVEGSDAEVPLEWIDLADERYMDEGGDKLAMNDFDQLVTETNDEACRLWDEANSR